MYSTNYVITDCMKNEIWRDIPGWSYEASNKGRIRRKAGKDAAGRYRPLKVLNPAGPRGNFSLRDKPRRKQMSIAPCILLVFVGPPPVGKPLACHKDDNTYNNRLGNLYWGSHKDNSDDAIRNGKFTPEIVEKRLSYAFKKGHTPHNKGKAPSQATRDKISKKLTGNIIPDNVKAKLSVSGKQSWIDNPRIWITDGFRNSRIPKNSPPPYGWCVGYSRVSR